MKMLNNWSLFVFVLWDKFHKHTYIFCLGQIIHISCFGRITNIPYRGRMINVFLSPLGRIFWAISTQESARAKFEEWDRLEPTFFNFSLFLVFANVPLSLFLACLSLRLASRQFCSPHLFRRFVSLFFFIRNYFRTYSRLILKQSHQSSVI